MVDNDMGGRDSSVWRFLRGENGFGGALVRTGFPGWVGRPRWAAGHPFVAAGGGMMGCAVLWSAGSIGIGRPRQFGGHDLHDPRQPALTGCDAHAASGDLVPSARTCPSRRA